MASEGISELMNRGNEFSILLFMGVHYIVVTSIILYARFVILKLTILGLPSRGGRKILKDEARWEI